MQEEYLAILSKAILFKDIITENLVCMLKCLSPVLRHYKRNEIITLAGESFIGIGILLAGEATVSKETFSGGRVVLNLIKPGDMFGEMIAFSDQSVWPATVQAQAVTSALFIPKDKIIGECEKLCPWHRTLILNLLKVVSNRALLLNKKVEFLSIRSMRAKLCTYLLNHYQHTGLTTFTLDMNRNELADYLNVSRPSMSRELGKMREEGLIDFHLSTIRILSLDALRQSLLNE